MVGIDDIVERSLDSEDLKVLIAALAKGNITNSQYVTLCLFKIIEAAQDELEQQEREERRGSGAW